MAPLIIRDIFETIKNLKASGLSILIVEQNALQTLKIADYAYVLQVGNVVREDKAEIFAISRKIWEGDDYVPLVFDDWVKEKKGEFTAVLNEGKIIGFW